MSELPYIWSGSIGHEVDVLSEDDGLDDFWGQVLGRHEPLLLAFHYRLDPILELHVLDQVGLLEGGKAPLPHPKVLFLAEE
jgi:hypothetical protein